LIIAGKDLRSELRRRTALVSAVVFAALILAIFNFARDPTSLRADQLAPSAFWITCAFAAVTALSRAFAVELEHGALDGLLLAPVPREALFLGKFLGNLVFVLVVESIALPLFVLFFNVSLNGALPGSPGGVAGNGGIRRCRHGVQCAHGAGAVQRTDAACAAAAVHAATARRCGAGHRRGLSQSPG
jgi:ABC-type transport system involved in multi-copper enzyme maturation permease subunit